MIQIWLCLTISIVSSAIAWAVGIALGKAIAFHEAAEHLRHETQPSPMFARALLLAERDDRCPLCECNPSNPDTMYECGCDCHILPRARHELRYRVPGAKAAPLTPPPEPLY